ncbi:MAG: hypothetical protein V2A73_02930 [Pseudomonadota bacterium]
MTAPRSPLCPNPDCAPAQLVGLYGLILVVLGFGIVVAFAVGVAVGLAIGGLT